MIKLSNLTNVRYFTLTLNGYIILVLNLIIEKYYFTRSVVLLPSSFKTYFQALTV